jgi:nucleotide-binding universal stress UspA family protein
MSATTALFVAAAVWIVIGLVSGIVMGRRGHGRFAWALTGALLGPLVVPVSCATAVRRQQAAVPPSAARRDSSDGLDVLAGVDGSLDATGALMTALALFGRIVDRLTIAIVVDYDAAGSAVPHGARRDAHAVLERDAQRAAGVLHREPQVVVLSGRPADAMASYARDGGYDLIVVGPRGRGASRLVFGSVASTFARGVGVPVAILPPAQLRDATGRARSGADASSDVEP